MMTSNLKLIQLVTELGEVLVVAEVYLNDLEDENRVELITTNHVGAENTVTDAPNDEDDPEYQNLLSILDQIRDALLGKNNVVDLRQAQQNGAAGSSGDWAHTQQS